MDEFGTEMFLMLVMTILFVVVGFVEDTTVVEAFVPVVVVLVVLAGSLTATLSDVVDFVAFDVVVAVVELAEVDAVTCFLSTFTLEKRRM